MAHDMSFSQHPCIGLASGCPRPRWTVGWFLTLTLLLPVTSARTFAEDPTPISIAELDRTEAVDFEKEILPILRKNCLACHNVTDTESDLVLETPRTIQQGGSRGPAVVPMKSKESLLLLVSAHREEPVMPPIDNDRGAKPLTSDELGLIKKWIDQGAVGTVAGTPKPLAWQPIPAEFRPILATGITADGQYAACGRANRLYIYHLLTHRLVAQLVDPGLSKPGGKETVQAAHQDLVQSLSFSPEGDLLASGGFRTVKLWRRLPNARLSEEDIGVTPGVLAMTDNSRWVASGESTGAIRLLDLTGEYDVRRLEGHDKPLTALAFSDDGMWLVSAAADKTVRVWNVGEGRHVGGFAVPATVHAMTLNNEGSQIITGDADHVIRVWAAPAFAARTAIDDPSVPGDDELGGDLDAKPATPVRELSGHEGEITALASLPGASHQFVSASLDGTLRHWDADQGTQIRKYEGGSAITALAVRPDGKRFVSVTTDKGAKLWNAEDGQLVAELKGDQRLQARIPELDRSVKLAEAEVVHYKSLQAAAEKQLQESEEALKKASEAENEQESPSASAKIASQNVEQAKQKISQANEELAAGERVLKCQQERKNAAAQAAEASNTHITSAAFAHDNTYLALGDAEGRIQLLDASTGSLFLVLDDHTDSIHTVHFAQDASLVSLAADGKMVVWELQPEWALERTIGHVDESAQLVDRVLAMDFSPDGKLLATGSGEPTRSGQLQIWQVADGQLVHAIDDAHSDTVFGVEFSPDGKTIASSAADRLVKTFQVADGQLVRSFAGHTHHALDVAWQANGRRLASAGADHVIKVWDPSTGAQQRTIEGYPQEVTSVSFVGVGSEAIATSGDATIRLHNTDNGQEIRKLEGAEDFVYSAVASAAGELVVAGGRDSVLRVWNLKTGELQGSFTPPKPATGSSAGQKD
jgi:WD40 repeat protein